MKPARLVSGLRSANSPSMAKKPVNYSNAWQEARELIWSHRHQLTLGILVMLVNRLSGLVLPASTKYLIDEVLAKGRGDRLTLVAIAVGGATLIQAVSSFALAQVVGVAAQRAADSLSARARALDTIR